MYLRVKSNMRRFCWRPAVKIKSEKTRR